MLVNCFENVFVLILGSGGGCICVCWGWYVILELRIFIWWLREIEYRVCEMWGRLLVEGVIVWGLM